MKKILFFVTALLALSSCSKEEIGGTATESMAGKWYVTIDAVDENGKPIKNGEDYLNNLNIKIFLLLIMQINIFL